jgi:hypothetical protein
MMFLTPEYTQRGKADPLIYSLRQEGAKPQSMVIRATNAGEDAAKQEPLYTAGGNAN